MLKFYFKKKIHYKKMFH